MGNMGFGKKWRSMIYECLSSSKLSVLINGSPLKEFFVRWGLRQKDLISPFLFDVVIKGLSILFQKASRGNILKGLQFASGIFLSHLQYTDDTLIFIPIDIDKLVQVKRILRWFALSSGLLINVHKSSIIDINVNNHLYLPLAMFIFCKSDSLPSKYLSMPLWANPSCISTWKSIIEKFCKRLHMWKGRLLSMAKHLCLIKNVLNSLPIYFMFVFKMPKGVGRLLSSIQRRFLWCGCTKQRSFCKTQWRLVKRDKKQEGLGVGSLIYKIRALLLKWIWRLSSPGTGLWKMIISSMYNPTYENRILIFCNQPSKI